MQSPVHDCHTVRYWGGWSMDHSIVQHSTVQYSTVRRGTWQNVVFSFLVGLLSPKGGYAKRWYLLTWGEELGVSEKMTGWHDIFHGRGSRVAKCQGSHRYIHVKKHYINCRNLWIYLCKIWLALCVIFLTNCKSGGVLETEFLIVIVGTGIVVKTRWDTWAFVIFQMTFSPSPYDKQLSFRIPPSPSLITWFINGSFLCTHPWTPPPYFH